MYEDFYQLTTNPFRLSPDPDFCFRHSGYTSAREYLEYALDQGEGFVMVAGRPGTGKTLLVETFLREIDPSRVVAKRIAVSNYCAAELLRAVAYAYEIDVPELDKATLRHSIQQYFLEQEQAGRRVLLILDEAQALQHSALEELRILADLQTQSRTMLQLFLVGQESLKDLMRTPEMEQFQQRVIANYHLIPLNLLDARAYIEHRLLHAGWNGSPEFTSAAVLSIFQLSRGVPRHINKICNRLMLLGFGKGSYIFDQEDAQAIAAEMHEEQLTPMTSGQTLLTDADSIREIRDGLISFDDLAIRVDKVDARAFAISEATRLAAMKKKQFIERHHDDPAARHPYNSSPADAVADTVNNEPLLGLRTLEPDNHRYSRPMAEPFLSRLKWKETFVGLAAMLAITTSSIPALPFIFNKAPGEDTLSQPLHQPRVIQDAIASVPSDLRVESVVAGVRELPVAAVEELLSDINVSSSSDQNQQPVVVPSDMIVSVAAIQWQHEVANDEAVSSNLSQDSQAIADRFVPTTGEGNADDNYPLAVDHIKGDVATEEEQHPVTAETVQTASVADAFELTDASRDEKIQELLSLGRQSIDKYRLLTPEDDNAYGYFRAVLRQDPDNEDARAGIKEIVALYIILARKSVDRHNDDRARRYINRGLSIQPENRELLALQDSINRAIQSASADTGIIAGGEGAPLESESPREGPKQGSLIQGIGSFFEKLKAEARSGEVHTPAGWNDTLP